MNELTLESTEFMKELSRRNSKFYYDILRVYGGIKPLLDNRISQVFSEYTEHDSKHSIRIINHMEKIVKKISDINDLELTLLIYAALLHDIGMAATKDEINKIKNNKLVYESVSYVAILNKFSNDENLAIQDFLRRVHAERSAIFIKENLKSDLIIPEMIGVTFEKELALICEAHTKDISWVKEKLRKHDMKGSYEYNPQFCALVLRLADILDFDSQRTPWRLYQAVSPKGYSNGEWLQHYAIENDNKVTVNERGIKVIEFYGTCNEPFIHRKILSYFDWINEEIENVNDVSKDFREKYRLEFYYKVNNFITSEEYSIVDLKFQVNYKRMLTLLMGEELYGKKELGLRELVQNSIDACLLKKEILNKNKELWEQSYVPKITIILDKGNNKVRIKDNGLGMNIQILKKYFLELGASYYNSDDYLMSEFDYIPIGNYGIGFLASFMLSNTIKVKTKYYNESSLKEVDILKDDEYVCIKQSEDYGFEGTEIELNYTEFFSVWETEEDLTAYLEKEFLSDQITISIVSTSNANSIKVVANTFEIKSDKHKINLTEYLEGVEVELSTYHDIKNKLFVKEIKEIPFRGIPLIYQDETLYNVDEEDQFKISDYINNNELRILNFMLIENADDLEKVLDHIDDHEEAQEKYEDIHLAQTISLITNHEFLETAPDKFVRVEEIIEGLTFEELREFGHDHDNQSGTFFNQEEKYFFSIDNYEKYLPINREQNKWFSLKKNNENLYIRGVFVKHLNFFVPNSILNFRIQYLNINIENKKIKPNVNRTEIKKDDENLLFNSIYQSICLYLYDHLTDPIEKLIVKKYLKEFHNYRKSLLKKRYQEFIDSE